MSRRALGRGRLLVALGAILSLAGMIPAWWTLARTNATGLSGNGLEGVGIVVFLAALALPMDAPGLWLTGAGLLVIVWGVADILTERPPTY